MTVSAWFRGSASPGNNRYLVAKGSNLCQAASYGLYSGPNGGMAFYVSGLADNAWTRSPEAPTSVWDGKWHNAAGTWDGSVSRLFIDGKEVENSTTGTTPPEYGTPGGTTTIGAYVGTCDLALTGDLDEVSSGRRRCRWPRSGSVRRCSSRRTDTINSLDHWGCSSAGRARGWQPRGRGFEPPWLHSTRGRLMAAFRVLGSHCDGGRGAPTRRASSAPRPRAARGGSSRAPPA
jgi:concanavalin A-like lectin/glucanase superfamily protein